MMATLAFNELKVRRLLRPKGFLNLAVRIIFDHVIRMNMPNELRKHEIRIKLKGCCGRLVKKCFYSSISQ